MCFLLGLENRLETMLQFGNHTNMCVVKQQIYVWSLTQKPYQLVDFIRTLASRQSLYDRIVCVNDAAAAAATNQPEGLWCLKDLDLG